MKHTNLIFFAFLMFVVMSCGLMSNFSSSTMMDIQKGMTQQEVSKLLGKPNHRSFNENSEMWEYRGYTTATTYSVMEIVFEDGRVVEMNTFEDPTVRVQTPPTPSSDPTTVVIAPTYRPSYRPDGNVSRREVMTDANFNRFMQSLNSGFSSDRTKKIENAMSTIWFTSAQAKRLLGLFHFSSEQVAFLKQIYPKIIDKQNFYTVIDAMSFSTDRNAVLDYINAYNKRR